MPRLVAIVLAGVAAALAGCGGRSADLLAVQRSGSIPGARLSLVINDGGTVTCNGRAHTLAPKDLVDARVLARDLVDPLKRHVALTPGPGSILTYRVESPDGAARFSDDSRGQPPEFFRLAFLVRRVAQQTCHLPR